MPSHSDNVKLITIAAHDRARPHVRQKRTAERRTLAFSWPLIFDINRGSDGYMPSRFSLRNNPLMKQLLECSSVRFAISETRRNWPGQTMFLS